MLLVAGRLGCPDVNLSWLNWSLAVDISSDGSEILFSESSTGVGGTSATFLRKLDGGPAVRLGDDEPYALSPDGKWVATLDLKEPPNIVLLPTGVGSPRQLTSNGWDYGRMKWRDSDSLIAPVRQPNHKTRLYSIDISTHAMHALLPEGIAGGWPSPDGRFLLGVQVQDRVLKIFTEGGQEVRSLGKLAAEDGVDKWSGDGKSILIWSGDLTPRLERMDAVTGKRYPFGEIKPPDMTGVVQVLFPRSTPDGKAHVYSEYRLLTDLFEATGLQ
jgi:eukaryotic-like serine/threonine-protein kinase